MKEHDNSWLVPVHKPIAGLISDLKQRGNACLHIGRVFPAISAARRGCRTLPVAITTLIGLLRLFWQAAVVRGGMTYGETDAKSGHEAVVRAGAIVAICTPPSFTS